MRRGGYLVDVPFNVLRRLLGSRKYGRLGSEDKVFFRRERVDRNRWFRMFMGR